MVPGFRCEMTQQDKPPAAGSAVRSSASSPQETISSEGVLRLSGCTGGCSVSEPRVCFVLSGSEEDREVHSGTERQDLRPPRPPAHRPDGEGPASRILLLSEQTQNHVP